MHFNIKTMQVGGIPVCRQFKLSANILSLFTVETYLMANLLLLPLYSGLTQSSARHFHIQFSDSILFFVFELQNGYNVTKTLFFLIAIFYLFISYPVNMARFLWPMLLTGFRVPFYLHLCVVPFHVVSHATYLVKFITLSSYKYGIQQDKKGLELSLKATTEVLMLS